MPGFSPRCLETSKPFSWRADLGPLIELGRMPELKGTPLIERGSPIALTCSRILGAEGFYFSVLVRSYGASSSHWIVMVIEKVSPLQGRVSPTLSER